MVNPIRLQMSSAQAHAQLCLLSESGLRRSHWGHIPQLIPLSFFSCVSRRPATSWSAETTTCTAPHHADAHVKLHEVWQGNGCRAAGGRGIPILACEVKWSWLPRKPRTPYTVRAGSNPSKQQRVRNPAAASPRHARWCLESWTPSSVSEGRPPSPLIL